MEELERKKKELMENIRQSKVQRSPYSEDEDELFVHVDSPSIFKESEKEEKTKKLTEIEPEVFEQMITNQGISIADYGRKGLKVFLFFFSSIGSENNGFIYFILKNKKF
jgi:hypothetical protein